MCEMTDHTREVERRVIAIPVKARDSCGFFEVRDGALAPRQECFFCKYSKFDPTQDTANPVGFCKFKK